MSSQRKVVLAILLASLAAIGIMPPGLAQSGSRSNSAAQNVAKPEASEQAWAAIQSKVIRNNVINEDYLSRLDAEMSRDPSREQDLFSSSYQVAALFLERQGDGPAAIERLRHGLSLTEGDLGLTLYLGYLLIKAEHPWDAIELLLPEADRYPQSAETLTLLGWAYYGMNDLEQAIREWSQSLALKSDAKTRDAMEKAQRELRVSGDYQELRSPHFVLRYDDDQLRSLASDVLQALEDDYAALIQDLGSAPADRIVVLLYPGRAFHDVARPPDWAGAENDGKIRVPVSDLVAVTPALARVLKHELTHSFVYSIAQGHCPHWFNEGLAQLEEGPLEEGPHGKGLTVTSTSKNSEPQAANNFRRRLGNSKEPSGASRARTPPLPTASPSPRSGICVKLMGWRRFVTCSR